MRVELFHCNEFIEVKRRGTKQYFSSSFSQQQIGQWLLYNLVNRTIRKKIIVGVGKCKNVKYRFVEKKMVLKHLPITKKFEKIQKNGGHS